MLMHEHQNFLTKEEAAVMTEKLIELGDAQEHVLLAGNSTSSVDVNQQVLKEFPYLDDRLQSALDTYTKAAGINDVSVFMSWYNIQDTDSQIIKHAHPTGVVSGVLYCNAVPGTSGIELQNFLADYMRFCWWDVTEETEYTEETHHLPIDVGTLVLIPSNLYHNSLINMTDKRVILAFDAKYHSQLGY